jgi:hypothetical protein
MTKKGLKGFGPMAYLNEELVIPIVEKTGLFLLASQVLLVVFSNCDLKILASNFYFILPSQIISFQKD